MAQKYNLLIPKQALSSFISSDSEDPYDSEDDARPQSDSLGPSEMGDFIEHS